MKNIMDREKEKICEIARMNKNKLKYKIIQILYNKYIKNIAITFHYSPDGDAIGSAVALALALQFINKNVDIVINSYSSIFNPILKNVNIIKRTKKQYDLCLLLDCSSRNRTIDLDALSKMLIVIDHHTNNEPIGNYYLCENKAATAMIIFDLIMYMKIPITSDIATALYLGLYSDTSGFTNSNMTSSVHYQSSVLLSKGVNLNIINQICKEKKLSMFKLLSDIFARIVFDEKYKIVYLVLMKEDLEKYNVTYDVVEYLMEELKHIHEAEISFLFIESTHNTKIKARSKGKIAVNKIMLYFNGNGFPNAAGAVIASTDIYSIVTKVIAQAKHYIDLI